MKTLLRSFVCFVCFVGLTALAHAQKNVQKSDATATRDEITADLKFGTGKTGTFLTGSALTLNSGSTLTLNGALAGTPTGGTLSLANLTLTLGTPAALTLTNATGLPIATGVSGLGTGVATFLAAPSSANLAAAVTGETGSGALVFGTSPTLTTPVLGVATATSITGATDLTLSGGSSGASLVLGSGSSAGSVSLAPTGTGNVNWGSKTNISTSETSIATARAVQMAITGLASPSSAAGSYIDYHTVDIVGQTWNTNVNAYTRLYPFESTARHGVASAISALVPGYFHWQVLPGAGAVGEVQTLRLAGDNESASTLPTVNFVHIENPGNSGGGAITALNGILIDSLTSGGTNLGINSQTANNYLAGLTVGTALTVPTGSNADVTVTTNGTGRALFANIWGPITSSSNKYSAGVTIGAASTTTSSLFVHTASINSGFSAGLGVSGTYSGSKATVNLTAYGPSSGGLSGDLAINSTDVSTVSEVARFTSTKMLLIGTPTDTVGAAGSTRLTGHIEGQEQASSPAAPATNGFKLYAKDNGAGKTVVYIRFATGAEQQIAIEP